MAARIARLSPSPPRLPLFRRDSRITCISSLVRDATSSAKVGVGLMMTRSCRSSRTGRRPA